MHKIFKKIDMKFTKRLQIIVVVALFCQNIFAVSGNGIYGETYSQSIIFSAGANYYFGDIEKIGIFSKYWHNQVNGFGQIGYEKSIYKNTLRFRANLLAAMLNGKRDNVSFQSMIIQPDVMLELYPITVTKDKMCNCDKKTVGLYLYGGVGLSLYSVNLNTPQKAIKYNSYAPMASLGAGYKFHILPRLELGFELGYRFALVDVLNVSLDGYPYRNDSGVIVGENTSKWNDGFYTFGITLGYSF